jgi:hypothetical protein
VVCGMAENDGTKEKARGLYVFGAEKEKEKRKYYFLFKNF